MNTNKTPLRTLGQISRVTVIAAMASVVVLAGCGDKKGKQNASQTAAKVNKEEITVHQINFVLQQQRGLRPEQAEAASKQILERLIDQELAVQKAEEMKLDRDPRVVQQMEAARREIISRAYLEKVGEGAQKPAEADVRKYYDEKPALFKDRRIYNIQELAIEAKPEQVAELRAKLEAAKSINEFVDYLKVSDIKFAANQAVRAAEQLPLQNLDAFAKLKDGQSIVNQVPNGLQIIVLAGSRSQPLSLEQASPMIEQFLLNERKRELISHDLKDLRAVAKIQYVGKFAEGAPAAAPAEVAASGASAAPAVAAPASAGGLDASAINKGMGLK